MYTKEQKERALKEYERLGSVKATITYLGYPSRHTLYDWIEIILQISKIIMVLQISLIKFNKKILMPPEHPVILI